VNPVLALALVLVAGLAATRLPRLAPRQLDLRMVHAAGTPLLLLGVLLGPASDVLDDTVLRALAPVTALAIGWAGAAFGARLQWRFVRRIPRPFWMLSASQAAASFAAVAGGTVLLALAVPALRAAWRPAVPVVLVLAAIAAVSGPGAVELAARTSGVRHAVARTLGTAATLDTGLGALAFTLALAIDHPGGPLRDGAGAVGAAGWLLLALGSGVLVGLLYLGLTRQREAGDRQVILLGTVLFGAGVGYAAGLSPFVVCAVAAALIANRSPTRQAVVEQLEAWEPPIYAVLLVLGGALLGLPTLWIVPAAVALAGLRIVARWAAGRYGRRLTGDPGLPRDAGLAGIAQGGVALALAINFLLVYRGTGAPAPEAVLTTIVLGIVAAQLAAPFFMNAALRAPELTASPTPAEVS
jgi:hypothetical protein